MLTAIPAVPDPSPTRQPGCACGCHVTLSHVYTPLSAPASEAMERKLLERAATGRD